MLLALVVLLGFLVVLLGSLVVLLGSLVVVSSGQNRSHLHTCTYYSYIELRHNFMYIKYTCIYIHVHVHEAAKVRCD